MILDTNALSAWADGKAEVSAPFRSAERIVVPVIALGEYLFGIAQSRHRQRYEEWLAQNLPAVELAIIDEQVAREYGQIRVELKKKATPIPANDAWIAAVVRHYEPPILSNDEHFDSVPGIQRLTF